MRAQSRKTTRGQILDSFAERASESRRSWALATVARCRGLLAGPAEFDEHFEAALAEHARTHTPFERARTELYFGERLRRVRRKNEAAPLLRSAVGAFEQLGATPWSERARRELGARPSRSRQAGSDPISRLTSHELQVASLVERGATNREAASALYVTPKTIEYHLANIYRKLEIRSRTELAYLLAKRG